MAAMTTTTTTTPGTTPGTTADGPRRVLVLGSTGSVGTQALDVIARCRDRFAVVGLAAGGGDVALLAAQARTYGAARVAVADPAAARALRRALPGVDVLAGPEAATELTATTPADTVLNGITGSRGLGPTLAALEAGATLALANKESLVAGGPLVTSAAAPGQIVPVDSEHSALAQCLRGGATTRSRRLVLTASGGPFRGRRRAELADVTPEQALAHPTWVMGPVVTINSATLVNKGLELIEAHLLFDVPYDRIDVVVHPQSVVHSMVDLRRRLDAGPGEPARHAAADRARRWAGRSGSTGPRRPAGWTSPRPGRSSRSTTTRSAVSRWPGGRARRAACLPAVFNAANEEAVAAFVAGGLGFLDITGVVEDTLAAAGGWRTDPATARRRGRGRGVGPGARPRERRRGGPLSRRGPDRDMR